MNVDIREEPIAHLDRLAEISTAFRVDRMLSMYLIDDGLGGIAFDEVPIATPWIKDYDAISNEGPARWAEQFDVVNWALFAARLHDRRVGGAVVAFDTPRAHMLEGRPDVAALWDIRVHPEARATGIGTELFRAVEDWARRRRCRILKAETQNITVPVCRFYQRMGCTLGAINRFAYADLPDEVQIIWNKQL